MCASQRATRHKSSFATKRRIGTSFASSIGLPIRLPILSLDGDRFLEVVGCWETKVVDGSLQLARETSHMSYPRVFLSSCRMICKSVQASSYI